VPTAVKESAPVEWRFAPVQAAISPHRFAPGLFCSGNIQPRTQWYLKSAFIALFFPTSPPLFNPAAMINLPPEHLR
jgi:hypothetical protein